MGLFQKFPQPNCKEVKRALKKLGFKCERQSGSHEQWAKTDKDGKRRLVTVDCPKEPFANDLVQSMAAQAGVSKREFQKLCCDKKYEIEDTDTPRDLDPTE